MKQILIEPEQLFSCHRCGVPIQYKQLELLPFDSGLPICPQCDRKTVFVSGETVFPHPLEGVGGGLLGTHCMNNSDTFGSDYVFLRHFSEINHKKKQRNFECLHYFVNDHIQKIRVKLMDELKNDFEMAMISSGDSYCLTEKELPLQLQQQYNTEIMKVRNQSLLTFAENQFLKYIAELKQYHRYIVLQDRNQELWFDGDGEPHEGKPPFLKRLDTRYSNSYKKKVVKRMMNLSERYRKASCVYVVLTLDPAKYNNDKLQMWLQVRRDIDLFLRKTRRELKRHGRELPPFLITLEAHKKEKSCGNPHVNMVFFGCTRLMDWRKIVQYWGRGNIRINRTRDGEKVRDPVKYVTKYITKTFSETDADNTLTQSLVWLFNKRSYTCSRGLIPPLTLPPSGLCDLLYFAVVTPHDTMLIDYDCIMDRMVSLSLVGGDG